MLFIVFRWTDKHSRHVLYHCQPKLFDMCREYGKKRILVQLIIGNSATNHLLFTCDIFHASQGTKPPVSKLLLLLLLVLSDYSHLVIYLQLRNPRALFFKINFSVSSARSHLQRTAAGSSSEHRTGRRKHWQRVKKIHTLASEWYTILIRVLDASSVSDRMQSKYTVLHLFLFMCL